MNPYIAVLFGAFGTGVVYLGYRLIVLGSSGAFGYTAGLTGWRLTLASTFPGLLFLVAGTVVCISSLRHVLKSSNEPQRKRVPATSEANVATQTNRPRQGFSLGRILPGKKIATIGALALAAILLIVFTGGVLLLSRRQTLASPDQEISSVVSVINERLTDVTLEPSHLILEGAARPRAQYMLTLGKQGPAAIYLFKINEYTIETGGDPEKIPTKKLCDLVEAVYDRPEPIFESLRQIKVEGKISFPIWKFGSADVQANLTSLLVQVLYAIRKFDELQHTYPEILIRGYADGKTTNWSRPLLGGNYHFTSIKAFFPTDPASLTPIKYRSYEETISLESGEYTNKHLPDLRAKFVEQDLVTPYLSDCKEKRNTQVHILKGYEFPTPNQPLERKVQIHILLRDVNTSKR